MCPYVFSWCVSGDFTLFLFRGGFFAVVFLGGGGEGKDSVVVSFSVFINWFLHYTFCTDSNILSAICCGVF